MEKYYALYGNWLQLLEFKNPKSTQIEFRVKKVHLKIKEARLEEFPRVYDKFLRAYEAYENNEFQECYNLLGSLYGDVLLDITDRATPVWGMNFIVGNSVVIVTQDLIDGRVINLQLRR